MGREARANQAGTAGELAPFLLTIPIAKVDKEKRLVSGPATCEVLDQQGDIVDYKTAKKFFTDPDLWPGNIREMHQPKAVGKKVTAECVDDDKVINLTSRVSTGAPDTWEKVLDGTLSMYSIGGSGRRVEEKTADGKTVKRLFLEKLAEVSLVDNGANQLAKFTIVKSVDGVPTDAEPAELETELEPVTKAGAALEAAAAAVATAKTVGPWYAGVDGKSIPMTTAADVTKALRGLARAKTADRPVVKANVIRLAYAHGLEAGLPDQWKTATDTTKVQKDYWYGMPYGADVCQAEPYDIQSILSAIGTLEQCLASEMREPGQAEPADVAQIGFLRASVTAAIQFLQSEFEEQFEDVADETTKAARVTVRKSVVLEGASSVFGAGLDAIVKAGARHSSKDMAMVQKVHDVSKDLGAVCKDMGDDDSTDADKAAKVAKAAISKPATDEDPTMHEDIAKLNTALDAEKAIVAKQAETLAKQTETIAAFETRLKLIEDGPAAGGPVRSAEAAKSLGGPEASSADNAAADAAIVKAFQQIATETDNPELKSAAAREILKFQTRTGSNAIAFAPR